MTSIADKPVTIRGQHYGNHLEAAAALGVKISTITTAQRYGTLDNAGLGMIRRMKKGGRCKKMTAETYNGQEDAERILEHTLSRRRWSVSVRDALQFELETLVRKYSR